jgi:hypothetical protein
MNTLVLDNPAWLPVHPEGVSLLGLPAEQSAQRSLSGSADDVLKTIAKLRDEMLLDVISRRTAEEFDEAVEAVFPSYVKLVLAFAKIAAAVARPQAIQRLANESFAELEADIREHGLASFGEDMRERAIFTVWTLRKTSDLLTLLEKAAEAGKSADESLRERDNRFHSEFLLHALLSRFHLDCLITSMRRRQPLYPDVLPIIDNGLKSAVNAYAWIKQAVDMRFPVDESEPLPDYWTDEDKQLVDASMGDLARYGVE